jgi:exonuclease SbcC
MEEAKQGAEDARTAAARAAEERTGLLEGIGLEGDADFPAAVEETRARVATTQATIDVLAGRLEDLERLEEKERATIGRHAVLERLAADLAPSKFQAFVLEEYRRALAELGSEQFEVLSGGRYRFSSDGAFDVIDLMAAEQARAADSLSGGETFLASLALALALAEMVARRGGRLDAFFLDEGFGSLDAEHLDLAMEGVERLVSGAERLVVVVSHVVALRDRIEDLITLDKDPLTGETRVRSGSEA